MERHLGIPKRKVIRVESEENAGLCERIIEPEPGRSRRSEFRAKRDQHPTKAHVLVFTIAAATRSPYTANLCQQCYNESLTAKCLAHFKELAVEGSRGKEGASWQAMENAGKDQFIQGKWEHFSLERVKGKVFMKDAEKESRKVYKANGNDSPPAKGYYLEQVKSGADTDWTPQDDENTDILH